MAYFVELLNAGNARNGKEDQFFDLILRTACGLQTKNEINGIREIAIFKSGVTL